MSKLTNHQLKMVLDEKIKEVSIIDVDKGDVLLFKLNHIATTESKKSIEDYMSNRFKCDCVVIDDMMELKAILRKKPKPSTKKK